MHLYNCPDCGPFEAKEDYHDEPKTRKCQDCGGFEGNIGYMGSMRKLPYVQSDSLPGGEMFSHADGMVYTSKREYIKGVERSGGNIAEERRYTKIEKPDSFDNKKFDQSFKKALEQHGL